MDGDSGGMDGGEMGGVNGAGMGDTDGDTRAGMESTDGDPGTSTLQSMGYIDSGAGMARGDRDSTDSGASVLQSVIIVAVIVFFGVSFVYFLLMGILAMFGMQL